MGYGSEESGDGVFLPHQKDDKRVIPLTWAMDNYSSKEQRETLRYISTLVRGRKNNLTRDGEKIRLHIKPETLIDTGTSATVSPTAKTITDTAKAWIINEHKGFWAGVKYDSDIGTGTIAISSGGVRTLTVTGRNWSADEYNGYYFYYGYNYYYIQGNTSDTLTLADVDSTLSAATSIDWAIEKYFRIASNTATVLALQDDDAELIAGAYSYYIDFLECRVNSSSFAPMQDHFAMTKEFDQTGYSLTLIEI
jgi:hypothetical protein